ncbi:MAG: Hpt domain-containing protein [Hyphomicrobiaceae bacterium]|nr:Hpt domain-containing protein [Hyphomicrobiaceae bacterium]
MSGNDQLRAILARHCASLPDEVETAAATFAEAVLRRDSYNALTCKVIEIVHKINGSSGSLGFGPLSTAARDFEDALIESRAAETEPDEKQIRSLYGLLEEMKVVAGRTVPEDSTLYQLDIAQLKGTHQT